ncbi:MAG: amino acid ABC transporter permease [Acidobacteria bacterium]|nr:amino acid ABC transporter permease [Gammaproteobacteria bacterium]MXZ59334.1 amino acid ABC transporter permease [Acidobacteriota bacterium]MYF15640.1 amino acid ABC transporter permease [Acidobacteriota bacterium]
MIPGSRRARLGWVDAAVLSAVVVALGYVFHRVDTVLEYRWDWSAIPNSLYRWDEETGRWVPNLLMQGFFTTIRLAILSMVPAALFGAVFGVLRTAGRLFPRLLSRTYVELIRNIPPLVFIFIFYFFISSQIMPILGVEDFVRGASPATLRSLELVFGPAALIPNVISGVICLAMFQGAYMTEIVRAGIQSVPKTQTEAGLSIGLSRWELWRRVILPQALRRVIPPLAGQFITLVKDSSILSLISIQELTFLAMETAVSTTRVFEVWITVAGLYFCLCYLLSLAFDRLERNAAAARA